MNLAIVGINHRSAGLSLREQYAIAINNFPDVCRGLVNAPEVAEAVVVSTCNRVELYVCPADGATPETAGNVARTALGPPHEAFYTVIGEEAARHLFRVCASLDSMVLGEPQILGQVKEAFNIARKAGTVGRTLQRCFDQAFHSAKRVRTETEIARSAVSVGHVAVELAKTIFGDIRDIDVLLVGAGKMGVQAAGNLADSGAKKVLVANRTLDRARDLARCHGWSARNYDDIPRLLEEVSVVICSTGAPAPVLTLDMVKRAFAKRRYRPLFLIDIAVPRDIEPDCAMLDNVYLYNIDDLEGVSHTNTQLRESEIEAAQTLIDHELGTLKRRMIQQTAAPVIKALVDRAQHIASSESEKTLRKLPDLDESAAETVRKLAEVVASRLTRASIEALKASAGKPGNNELVTRVQQLFELESDDP